MPTWRLFAASTGSPTGPMPEPLSAIDLAEVAGRFGHLLHLAGVPVTPMASGRFASAVALARPQRVDELRWLARVTLVADRAHFDAFQRTFDQVFGGLFDDAADGRNANQQNLSTRPSDGAPPPSSRSGESRSQGGEAHPDMPGSSSSSGSEDDAGDGVLAAASGDERLSAQAFGQCTPVELERLLYLITQFRIRPPQRHSRRTRVHPLGADLDLRATLRASQRTGGDPVHRIHRRRRSRPRRVVLIADVSGSMESYGRAYLYLLHGAVRAIGAEAFVFATRLHRLTRPLAMQHPGLALAKAMKQAPDWSGGTRIGGALQAFNSQHGRRGVGRGAIVVIVSDGWEGGDVSLLGREMERLSRLAHRIVWVNPRKQRADYQPLVGGMAAALPWVDEFVSGHSIDSLGDVVAAISRETPRTIRRPKSAVAAPDAPAMANDSTVVPRTSMNPDFGTVTSLSHPVLWEFTSGSSSEQS
jgi:uncharacterized protein